MTYFNMILIIPVCTNFFPLDLTEILERKSDFSALFGLPTYGLEKIAKMLNVCRSEVTTPAVGQDRDLSSPVHLPFCPHSPPNSLVQHSYCLCPRKQRLL